MIASAQDRQILPAGLVRLLAGWADGDVPPSRQPLADRLGQWLTFTDALALFSALEADATASNTDAAPSPAVLRAAFDRLRHQLADRAPYDAGELLAADREAPDFSAYERQYFERQRMMSAGIGPLRANLRAALARRGPAQRQLAALDAVLERALAPRERELLARIPDHLARRFHALHAVQATTPDPAQSWRAAFLRDFHATLQAELALRLRPVAGLLAALELPLEADQDRPPTGTLST